MKQADFFLKVSAVEPPLLLSTCKQRLIDGSYVHWPWSH